MSTDVPPSTSQTESKAERAAKNLKLKITPQLIPAEGASRRNSSSVASMALKRDQSSSHVPGENVLLENTYKMTPDKTFPTRTIKGILKEVLTEKLSEMKYETKACRQLTKTLSDELKTRVKELNIPRYKIITILHIGSLRSGQSIRIGSRCLWDTNCDTYSSYEFKNNSLFAVAMVYGVYFE